MKPYLIFTIGICLLLCGLSACDKQQESYTIPINYNFENVNHDHATYRLRMLDEMAAYMQTASAPGAPALSEQKLLEMFNNSNEPFQAEELNSSTVQIENKTITHLRSILKYHLRALAITSQYTNETAAPIQAGIRSSSNGIDHYLLTAKGVDLAAIIEVQLASMCFYYQVTSIYLGVAKMSTDNKTVVPGLGTMMEHYWDEAFGYLGASKDFPMDISNLGFWATHSNQVNPHTNSNIKLMHAFLSGRAALSANDFDTRNAMIEEIRQEWEIMIAANAISYLNKALANATDAGRFFHYLSRSYAFIESLKYGANNLDETKVNVLLKALGGNTNVLQANFYNTLPFNIHLTINGIVDIFPSLAPHKNTL